MNDYISECFDSDLTQDLDTFIIVGKLDIKLCKANLINVFCSDKLIKKTNLCEQNFKSPLPEEFFIHVFNFIFYKILNS